MNSMRISKLEEISLRTIWAKEDQDFTQWLAKEENINQLVQELGIELENIQTEYSVGDFRADIIAEDSHGDYVLIENQLEATNHSHLGQIITYASGLEAKTIIWIVKEARKEHMSAIEWLNSHTSNELNFFLIQVRAFKIDNSHPAPKFEIIIQPNEWYKDIQTKTQTDINPIYKERQKYFSEFVDYVKQIDSSVRLPQVPHYLRTYYNITSHGVRKLLYQDYDVIKVILEIRKKDFDIARTILDNKQIVEKSINCTTIQWNESMLETHQSIWIGFEQNVDGMDKKSQFKWLYENYLKLTKIFQQYSS